MKNGQRSAAAFLAVWTGAFLVAAAMNTSPGFIPIPHAEKAWALYWAAITLGSALAAVLMHKSEA